MIIVEGMDNTGKSTLVKKLSKDLKLLTINNQRRPTSIPEAFRYLDGVIYMAASFPVIVDRWQPISEPIYGPICRDVTLFPPASLARMMKMTSSTEPLIIYCRPPDPVVLDFKDEQMDGVIRHASALLDQYDISMNNLSATGFTVISYDWTSDDYSGLSSICNQHFTS